MIRIHNIYPCVFENGVLGVFFSGRRGVLWLREVGLNPYPAVQLFKRGTYIRCLIRKRFSHVD